jgi:hypothetical protein
MFKREPAAYLFFLADLLGYAAHEVADGIAFDAFLALSAHVGEDCGVTPLRIKGDVDPEKENGISHGNFISCFRND